MNGTERRRVKRVAFFCEAQLEGADVTRSNVRLADISVDGAFVDARSVLPPGSLASLRFTLLSKEVGATVEIRYSMPGMGMGLRFVDMSDEDRGVVRRFMALQG